MYYDFQFSVIVELVRLQMHGSLFLEPSFGLVFFSLVFLVNFDVVVSFTLLYFILLCLIPISMKCALF